MQVVTKAAKPLGKPTIWAAGALTMALMVPLNATAHHDQTDILEAILGAGVVYTVIDSLDDDHDRHRSHRDRHRHHDRYHDRRHHGHRVGYGHKHGRWGKADRRAHRAQHHYRDRYYRDRYYDDRYGRDHRHYRR